MERHPFAPSYLVAGVVFVAVAVVGLAGGLNLDVGDLRWLGPVLLVLLGIGLLFGTARRRDQDEPVTSSTAPPSVDTAEAGASPDHATDDDARSPTA